MAGCKPYIQDLVCELLAGDLYRIFSLVAEYRKCCIRNVLSENDPLSDFLNKLNMHQTKYSLDQCLNNLHSCQFCYTGLDAKGFVSRPARTIRVLGLRRLIWRRNPRRLGSGENDTHHMYQNVRLLHLFKILQTFIWTLPDVTAPQIYLYDYLCDYFLEIQLALLCWILQDPRWWWPGCGSIFSSWLLPLWKMSKGTNDRPLSNSNWLVIINTSVYCKIAGIRWLLQVLSFHTGKHLTQGSFKENVTSRTYIYIQISIKASCVLLKVPYN